MPTIRTHYDNLKVARNAPPEVIRAAYRVLAQKYHPFPICLVPGNHIVQNCLDTRYRFGSLDPTTVRNDVLELEKTFP